MVFFAYLVDHLHTLCMSLGANYWWHNTNSDYFWPNMTRISTWVGDIWYFCILSSSFAYVMHVPWANNKWHCTASSRDSFNQLWSTYILRLRIIAFLLLISSFAYLTLDMGPRFCHIIRLDITNNFCTDISHRSITVMDIHHLLALVTRTNGRTGRGALFAGKKRFITPSYWYEVSPKTQEA